MHTHYITTPYAGHVLSKSRSETIAMPMIRSLIEHGFPPVFSIEGKVMLYYHSFSGPNVCLARLQMELCRAANIFAVR